MGAATLDLNINQGATFLITCTVKNPSGTEVDLTGWSFTGQIREAINSTSVSAAFTITLADQVSNTGEFTVSLTPAQTRVLQVGSVTTRKIFQYFYDIEATKPDLTVDRILEGKAFVSPEVTR